MGMVSEDKDQVRELLARYCYYADSGQVEHYANLFTLDCDWDGGIFGRQLGRENVLTMMRSNSGSRPKTRHSTTNIVITLDGDKADATSYVTVMNVGTDQPSVIFVGCYIDRLSREDGKWLFQTRRIRPDLAEAGYACGK